MCGRRRQVIKEKKNIHYSWQQTNKQKRKQIDFGGRDITRIATHELHTLQWKHQRIATLVKMQPVSVPPCSSSLHLCAPDLWLCLPLIVLSLPIVSPLCHVSLLVSRRSQLTFQRFFTVTVAVDFHFVFWPFIFMFVLRVRVSPSLCYVLDILHASAWPCNQIKFTWSIQWSGCSKKAPLWNLVNVSTFKSTQPPGFRIPSPSPPAWSQKKKRLFSVVNEGTISRKPGWTMHQLSSLIVQ